nr:odorant-binding protein [Agasicles hygrophila]
MAYLQFASVLLLVCISKVLSADQLPEESKNIVRNIEGYNDCLKTTGITEEQIFKIPPSNSRDVMCFSKCLGEKKKSINSDGTVNIKAMEEAIKDMQKDAGIAAKLIENVKKCLTGVEVKECEDMIQFNDCLMSSFGVAYA